jgi:hypothetical protein
MLFQQQVAQPLGTAESLSGIFALFLQNQSLADTLDEMERRGWKTKGWTTRKSKQRTGLRFDRPAEIEWSVAASLPLFGLQAVFPELLVEQSPMNSEDLGGPRLVSQRLFHRSLYERSFQGFDVRFQAIFKWDRIGPFLFCQRRLKFPHFAG